MKRKLFAATFVLLCAICAAAAAGCSGGSVGGSNGNHTHTYSAQWSYDESYHWHAATCGHDGEISDKSVHNYGKNGVCNDCGYKSAAGHVHLYELKFNSAQHWRACGCGDIVEKADHVFKSGRCTVCNYPDPVASVTPPDGHKHVAVHYPRNEPTCSNAGNIEYWQCEECKEYFSDADCKNSINYGAITLMPVEHTYVTLDAVDATCTEGGLTLGEYCSVCNKVFVEQTATPPTGHSSQTLDAVEPTCTESGLTEGVKCFTCNEVLTAQTVIPANGHDEKIIAAVSPTCIAEGSSEGKSCDVCGEVLVAVKTVAIDPDAHKEVKDEAKPATCIAVGKTEGKHCSLCKKVLIAQQPVPVDPNAHTLNYNECKGCGKLYESQGLEYELNAEATAYKVVGVGSFGGKKLVIPSEYEGKPVTEIGEEAFSGGNYTLAQLPDGITRIGASAFSGCSYLLNVNIPESVSFIGGNAFSGCVSLDRVDIKTFDFWLNISFVNEASHPFNMRGGSIYLNDELLKDIVVPDGTTKINQYAFLKVKGIESVTIPASVTSLGTAAFKSCYGTSALQGNYNVNYGGTVEEWCALNFADSYSNPLEKGKYLLINGERVTRVELPLSVGNVNAYAFINSCVTDIAVPYGITVGSSAFSGCALVSAEISASYIGDLPKTKLKSLVINGGYKIARGTLSVCNEIESLTVPFVGETADSSNNWLGFIFGSDASLNSLPSSLKKVTVAGGDKIAASAFKNCSNLTEIVIGNTVKTIGKEAFANCSELQNVYIGDSVTQIGEQAFALCFALKNLNVGKNVNTYGNNAFQSCTKLEKVYISDIVRWSQSAFSNKYANPVYYSGSLYLDNQLITRLVYPYVSKLNIKQYAFINCKSLVSVTLPENTASIGESAFADCDKLVEIYNLSLYFSVTQYSTENGYVARYAKDIYTSESTQSKLVTVEGLIFYENTDEVLLLGCSDLVNETSLPVDFNGKSYKIYKSAFDKQKGLEVINFNGTAEQWNALEKGENWDRETGTYTVNCLAD